MTTTILLGHAIEKFLNQLSLRQYSKQTLHGYAIDLKQLHAFLTNVTNGPVLLDEITTEHLESFQKQLLEQPYSPATVNRKINSVRSLFNWVTSKKMIRNNCAVSLYLLRIPCTERYYLTANSIEQFLQYIAHPTVQIIAQFIINTGLRINECIQLRLNDIDFEQRLVHVVNGKGKKSRIVPMNSRTYYLICYYVSTIRPQHTKSLYLFALEKTGSISPQYINQVFKEASIQMNSPQLITCHILRHTFASNLVKQNIHISIIQKLLGHANVRSTSIYMHADLQQLKNAVEHLN
ncbi:tyrosine-type recombinase/integrase [Metasolibacillus sp. FSL K6-0083]|uniref:tyrosine-type recombinase/integrase n=1 Tax=Metasolibacillus sp. FSL K6-0083 TaxID=2921416 RepID=UPI00315A397A